MPNLVAYVPRLTHNLIEEQARLEGVSTTSWLSRVVKDRMANSSSVKRHERDVSSGVIRILSSGSRYLKRLVQNRIKHERFGSESELLYCVAVEALSAPSRIQAADRETLEKRIENFLDKKLSGEGTLDERVDQYLDRVTVPTVPTVTKPTLEKKESTVKFCSEPGCTKKYRAKGYCVGHYCKKFPRGTRGKKATVATKKAAQAKEYAEATVSGCNEKIEKKRSHKKKPVVVVKSPQASCILSKRRVPSAKVLKSAAAAFSAKDLPSFHSGDRQPGYVYPRLEVSVDAWSALIVAAKKVGRKPEKHASMILDAFAVS